MKKIILVLVLIILFVLTFIYFSVENSLINKINGNEVKFSGTITETSNGCWADGVCKVKLDNSWIEIVRGGLRPFSLTEKAAGNSDVSFNYNTDKYIGQKAEFYGVKTNIDNYYTVYGSWHYYLKLLK